MDNNSKKDLLTLENNIRFHILFAIRNSGITDREMILAAILGSACDFIIEILEKNYSREFAYKYTKKILEAEIEIITDDAKNEGYDLENL